LAHRSIIMLAALFSAAAVAGTPAAATAAGNCVPASNWPADRADLAAQVVTLVNAHRAQLGLVPLVVSPTLTAAAEWKARNMAAYDYLDHDDPAPDARTADERVLACGYPATQWGENIGTGYATAQAVVDAWLASPEHRENIERPEYRATGVGAAGAPTMYWAQSFGAVADAGSAASAPVALTTVLATATTPSSASTAAAMAAHRSGTKRPVRVTCAQRGRGVACRVLGRRGTLVRIALMRSGRTFARARTRAAADPVRVVLHPMRRLRAGRYALIVRAGSAARGHEWRMSMVLR
jgi:uncharacterized protein YkwD